MTDLETRLRDELGRRADGVRHWSLPGEDLRELSQGTVTRRRVTVALALIGAAAVVATAVVTGSPAGDHPRPVPPASATAKPDGLLQVEVPGATVRRVRMELGLGTDELLAAARLPLSGDPVLVFRGGGFEDRSVVNTVTVRDGELVHGTLAHYGLDDPVVAQPAVDGEGWTLVVVDTSLAADTALVSTSRPGADVEVTTGALHRGIALVPVQLPKLVTRVRLLRDGETVRDIIPGGFGLRRDVPPVLDRVVATDGRERGYQSVQVRTDGTTACRVTVNADWAIGWVVFDTACARVDRSLQLLLARDRHNSSVTGVAPPDAVTVRLTWRGGDVTEVPVVRDDVPAFVDTSERPPDSLVVAEALDADDNVVGTAKP